MKFNSLPAASLAVAIATLPAAIAASPELPRWLDPTAREAARGKAALNPVGIPLRDHTNANLASLGFDANDRFELTRARVDEYGYTHAVLQQWRQGVPVYGGRLIAHRDVRGVYEPYSDAGIRAIRTSSRPSLSSAAAVAKVEVDATHLHPFATAPSATRYFYPKFQRVLKSGAPLPPVQFNPTALHSMVESVNAADTEKKLVATHLAWRVTGVEHDAATGNYRPAYWWVDAHDGSILGTGELSHAAGTGNGVVHGWVNFNTLADDSCYRMEDKTRQFRTETEDFGSDDPVNCDSNDIWGDGQAFVGDANSPTTANWQTAMVDGHYGATVYWDMMDNVFGFQGPDDDYYSVNLFMHHGTNVNNAFYHQLSGNVVFGDGSNGMTYTNIDVIGHELGHAWDDHNSQIDGSSPLNESFADVLGEWNEVYLQASFASSSTFLGDYPDNPSNWVSSIGRNLENPNASGHPAYWSTAIDNMEVHEGSLPASRAFTFLANGSASWVDATNYSRKLPWGMYGLGLSTATKIYLKAHQDFLISGEYDDLADVMQVSAFFTSVAAAGTARNAYAGINVGVPVLGYPMAPPVTAEVEPNSALSQAQFIATHTPPPAGAIAGSPNKIKIEGGGTSRDYYSFRMVGNKIAVQLTPTPGNSLADFKPYAVVILSGGNPAVPLAVGVEDIHPQVLVVNFSTIAARSLRVAVLSSSATANSKYQLDIDTGVAPP